MMIVDAAELWNSFPVAGDEPEGWDFFISYTQTDRRWAEWIAWCLKEAGYRVFEAEWNISPGSNWIERVEYALPRSEKMIAVLSPAYLKSRYASAEWRQMWREDPGGEERKLVPVRVAPCDRPGLLNQIADFSLIGLTETEAREKLLIKAKAAVTGHGWPVSAPPYPEGPRYPGGPQFPGAGPRVWNLPPENRNFTGRVGQLAELNQRLADARRATVHGMGGVGKTSLATQYAYEHAAEYEVVWRVAAEDPALLEDQFEPLLGQFGQTFADDPKVRPAQVHRALTGVTGWLLIFDNASRPADIEPWLPPWPPSSGGPGHVIVTTRRDRFKELGQVLPLPVLDLAEAVTLIRTRAHDLAQDTAEQIAGELGRLPLALEQAGAYLDNKNVPGERYLNQLREQPAELYRQSEVSAQPETVDTLWNLSLGQVGQDSPGAIQLLAICAYLAPEPVPLDLFADYPDLLPAELSAKARHPVHFDGVVGVLHGYSLATRRLDELQTHRLLQAVVRARYDGNAGWRPLERAVHLLRTAAPGEVSRNPGAWPRWAVLLPHVLAATAFAENAHAPDVNLLQEASWLLDRAGTYHYAHARLDDALPLLRRARTLALAAYGRDHPTVAIRLSNLAAVLHDLGRLRQARSLLTRALKINERVYQDGQPGYAYVAASLGRLAVLQLGLGQPEQARRLLKRAVRVSEACYGPVHPEVARHLGVLAAALRDLGWSGQARPLAERALAINEHAYHGDHPAVAASLGRLAVIQRDLGQLDKAAALAARAVAMARTVYSPDHPAVADLLDIRSAIARDQA